MTGDTESDVRKLLSAISALGVAATSDSLHMVTIPGPPWSKARPRFSRNGTYAKPEDQDAEQRTAWHLKRRVREPYPGNVGLACLFYRPNHQRIDADNLLKHVCDAANGVLWLDDSQCTAIMGIVELDATHPRTVIMVGTHTSTLKRGSDASVPCKVCGKLVLIRDRAKTPKTCSRECHTIYKGYRSLAEPIPCAQCQKLFTRRTKTQTLCSQRCRIESVRDKQRGNKPFSQCTDCGKTLAHKRGGRCRDCWKKSMPGRQSITGTIERQP